MFGVVGSGKSEQANRLEQKLGCRHITVSRLLESQSRPEWQRLMRAGKLVPDADVISVLEPELDKEQLENKEFILDGAPRSLGQAKWLVEKIKAGQLSLTAIFHLKVSKETTLKRLLTRARKDDSRAVISERFHQYDQITTPVINYLTNQGLHIYEVDGEAPLEEVEKQIWLVLKDKIGASKV